MGSYKASALVVALLSALVRADYHSESYKVVRIGGDQAPYGRPWFLDEYAAPYYSPVAAAFESVAEQRSPEVYEYPAEDGRSAVGGKRHPIEDKNFKKSISPFYTLTDSDSPKYKSIVLKSGVPYCQETKSRVPGKRFRRDAMTCIKCKDPKNGLTHEQCSYTSDPQEAKGYETSSSVRRYRRSNGGVESGATPKGDASLEDDGRSTETGPGFRFGDEYFAPAASDEIVKKHKEQTENCEKIVKDSMVCMVCKDPKTNGKYEQCSYTNQPNEKAYSYSRSRTSGNPAGEKGGESETGERGNTAKREYPGSAGVEDHGAEESHHPEVDKYFEEQTSAIKERSPKYEEGGFGESEGAAKLESGSESAKDGTCKKIVKDTMVCTVCANPKTGGNYEQCSYAYQPNDKIYQFSKQKSFGYPDKNDGESSGKYSSATETKPNYETSAYGEEAAKKNDDYPGYREPASYRDSSDEGSGEAGKNSEASYRDEPSENRESYDYSPYKIGGTGEDEKSESERISDKIDKEADCKKVEKDTMTCMVCKDPKTGGNYEQCSYAYRPNDKLFAFSTAKSFGSPEADDKGSDYGSTSREYGLASDSQPYVASDSASFEQPRSVEGGGPLGVGDFYSTAKKKEAIDKVLSEFEKEDRSKCKKILRDKLTCFQCTDKEGMQKEECIFVAARKPAKDRLAYREVKEFQRNPEADGGRKRKRKTRKTSPKHSYAEPVPAGTENVERSAPEDAESQEDVGERESVEAAESEPYNFAEETKPTYDKVLGLTLPRYMLTTSEHEAEFDEVVASSRL
ncbi:uncharacterized protein LOC105690346 [Athalia rosae]|uniref:uncharacterized protein LOC105690346 n=1 Tax=Athalia rosae TaxID=37344 RepID=UPI00203414B3|nr:uncharacterized protein LOC105690346 [Athalia rosae]